MLTFINLDSLLCGYIILFSKIQNEQLLNINPYLTGVEYD